ncbi:hypothetical protein BV898_16659 [Hypsibius exemplaris]|uniref:Uncharacterized protein n=1 Tax=Hypsibius exemplaris TaxID=2072580 RepID=A0A9X6NDM0_HYPEX|nr:hypothetical protein BV898_16659 [Hypsibius exemplaris]
MLVFLVCGIIQGFAGSVAYARILHLQTRAKDTYFISLMSSIWVIFLGAIGTLFTFCTAAPGNFTLTCLKLYRNLTFFAATLCFLGSLKNFPKVSYKQETSPQPRFFIEASDPFADSQIAADESLLIILVLGCIELFFAIVLHNIRKGCVAQWEAGLTTETIVPTDEEERGSDEPFSFVPSSRSSSRRSRRALPDLEAGLTTETIVPTDEEERGSDEPFSFVPSSRSSSRRLRRALPDLEAEMVSLSPALLPDTDLPPQYFEVVDDATAHPSPTVSMTLHDTPQSISESLPPSYAVVTGYKNSLV